MSIATLERKKDDELESETSARFSRANDERFSTQLMANPDSAASAAALMGTSIRLLIVVLIICLTLQFIDRIANPSRPAGDDWQNYSQLGVVFPFVGADTWTS